MPKKKDLFLIYLPNEYIEDLSKDYLKRLLSRNSDIAEQYEDKENLISYSIEIVDKINKKVKVR